MKPVPAFSWSSLVRWEVLLEPNPGGASLLPPIGAFSNPTLVGEGLLAASLLSPGKLVVVREADGLILWSHSYDGLGRAHVSFDGGVLFGGTASELIAFQPDSGAVIWRWRPYEQPGEHIYSSPCFFEGLILMGDRHGFVSCLDASSGAVRWSTQTNKAPRSPAPKPDGSPAAAASRPGQVNSTACISPNGVLAVATTAGAALALDPRTGRDIWTTQLDGSCLCPVQLHDGHFVAATTKSVYVLDAHTGRVAQRFDNAAPLVMTPALAQRDLLLTLGDGRLIGRRRDESVFDVACDATYCAYDAVNDFLYTSSPHEPAPFRIRDASTGEELGALDFPDLFEVSYVPGYATDRLYFIVRDQADGERSPTTLAALNHPMATQPEQA